MAPWPRYDQDEIDAVSEVLRSGKVNYWTGTQGREFEREFAEFTGVRHAVFVANGTLALELGLRALELPAGSEVITTPHTFIATASAIVAVGLRPVFADIDPDSGNITPETIAEAITRRTSAVIVVHLGGWPARMPQIQALCSERGLKLIEDCAQAQGAKIGDQHVGTFSDIAAWSFCQDKIITTGGEGGMVGTDDPPLWRRMWSYKDHGKSWEAVYEREHPPGFRWLHESFGSNWRGTEMQAAIGRIQYQKLPDWHKQRTENATQLEDLLDSIRGIRVPRTGADETHAYYRLYARLDVSELGPGWSRDRLIGEMHSRGTPMFTGSCAEIYRENAFVESGMSPAKPLPNAAARGDDVLAFLVHPGMTHDDMTATAENLQEALWQARP
jgi:dTDP-4-amino-4,6-dideoxygalactose transaminase